MFGVEYIAAAVGVATVPIIYKKTSEVYARWVILPHMTEDITASAHSGDLPCAYAREDTMVSLETAVSKGSVVLIGPAGSGKTALVEELARRIIHGDIASLKGVEIRRFKWADTTARSGGLQQWLANIVYGTPASQIPKLLAHLKSTPTKKYILFIDEIQDFLRNNLDALDDFKELMASGRIRIIGATTDGPLIDEWLNRPNSGTGMRRRVRTITIAPMSLQETQTVLTKIAQGRFCTLGKYNLRFSRESLTAICVLAPQLFREKVYPDSAVSLLTDIHNHALNSLHRGDFLQPLNSDIELPYSFVCQYVSRASQIAYETLCATVEHRTKQDQLCDELTEKYFVPIQPCSSTLSSLYAEQLRLYCTSNFHNVVFMQGALQSLLVDIAVDSWQGSTVYLCDLQQLMRDISSFSSETSFKAMVRELLAQPKTFFILTNFLPEWITAAAETRLSKQDTHRWKNTFATTALKTAAQCGMPQITLIGDKLEQLAAVTDALGSDDLPQVAPVPPLICWLLQAIQEEKTAARFLLSSPLKTASPFHIFDCSPPLHTMLQYMQEQSSQDSDTIIRCVRLLCTLPLTLPALDLAFTTLQLMSTGTKFIDAIFAACSGLITKEQIERAWKHATTPTPARCGETIDAQLHTSVIQHLNVRGTSVLWIEEESAARQAFIINRIASVCDIIDLRPYPLAQITCENKQLLLDISLLNAKPKHCLLLPEETIDDPLFSGHHLVAFRKTSPPAVKASQGGLASFVSAVLQEGSQQREVTPAPKPYQETTFTPPPLTAQEVELIIASQLIYPEAKKLARLYRILYDKGYPLDFVCREALFCSDKVTPAITQFHSAYGSMLKMSQEDIQYVLDPSQTSTFYRFKRAADACAQKLWHLATLPIRLVKAVLHAATHKAAELAVSTVSMLAIQSLANRFFRR